VLICAAAAVSYKKAAAPAAAKATATIVRILEEHQSLNTKGARKRCLQTTTKLSDYGILHGKPMKTTDGASTVLFHEVAAWQNVRW
jgi:hypothetical protein